MKRGCGVNYEVILIFILSVILISCTGVSENSGMSFNNLKAPVYPDFFSGGVIGDVCTVDSDCGFGNVCENKICKVGCLQDSDCATGSTCNIDNGKCISKGQCTTDSDCKEGKKIRCDLSSSSCVECYEQEHCTGDLVCDFNANECKAVSLPTLPTPPITPEEKKVNLCVDSDTGKDYLTAGTLKGTDISGNVIDQRDQCAGDGMGVNEYYCTETSFTYETYQCPKGCKDGACVKEEMVEVKCTDPDGNEEGIANNKGVYTKSITKGKFWSGNHDVVEKTDYCSNDKDIGEYYCQADGYVGVFGITCPNGCKDGACVKDAVVPILSQPEEVFVLKEKESKAFTNLTFTLNKADAGAPYHEINYVSTSPQGYAPGGNVALGNIDYVYITALKKYLLINALDRTSDSVTFKVRICAEFDDASCFDEVCPEYTYKEKKFKNGKLSKWSGTIRKLCTYEIEGGDTTIPKVICEDSDGGIAEFVKGTAKGEHATASPYVVGEAPKFTEYKKATGSVSTHNDYCLTETKLSEASCDEKGKLKSTEILCQKGCKDGVCVKEEKKVNLCVDSDNGKEYFTTGTLKGTDISGNVIDQRDQCAGDGIGVNEYFCTNTSFTYETYQCPNGCKGGACITEIKTEAKCTDPDAEDLSKATVVKYLDANGVQTEFKDECLGIVGIMEGMCTKEGSFACVNKDDCRRRCPQGQVCTDGACAETTSQCTDSDGGNKNTAGVVSYTDLAVNVPKTIQDKCISLRFVEEGMCNSINQGRINVLKCADKEVCKNGACVVSPEQCSDTDGNKRETKGKVSFVTKTGSAGTFTDKCTDELLASAFLIEGLCKENTFTSRGVPCPPGTLCKDGACVAGASAIQNTCTDSDNGFNAYVKGKVTSTSQSGTIKSNEDYCADTRTLQEYYCSQNQVKSLTRNCYEGACLNGICTTVRSTGSTYSWGWIR